MTCADPAVQLPDRTVDRVHTLRLTGSMAKYDWGINGHHYDDRNPVSTTYDVRRCQRIQINYVNDPMHPMHPAWPHLPGR